MSVTEKRYLLSLEQGTYDEVEAAARATILPGGKPMSVADWLRVAVREKLDRDKRTQP